MAPILEEFASWLTDAGYSRQSTQDHVQRLKRVFAAIRSVPQQRSSAKLNRAFSAVFGQPEPLRTTAKFFRQHLQARGRLAAEDNRDPFAGLLARYQQHLVQMRGLAAHTVQTRLATARNFLSREVSDEAGLQGLSAEAVERYLILCSFHYILPEMLWKKFKRNGKSSLVD